MISILCRYGELFLKGGNRGFFLRAMADNVRRAVRAIPDAKVATPYGRILVRVPDESREDACGRLERVFGLVSVSPGAEAAPDLAAITTTAVAEARLAVAHNPALASFKVEARRTDKNFPVRSHDIDCHVGGAVIDALGARTTSTATWAAPSSTPWA
jgi:tRNA uracil 4-sulfurtransferase